MGVQGLKTFMQDRRYLRKVSIAEEIENWKRRNPAQTPIIVFDIAGLRCSDDALFLGGNSSKFDNDLEKWLACLVRMGTKLVFFKSVSHATWRVENWMRAQAKSNNELARLYNELGPENTTDVVREKLEHAGKSFPSLNLRAITSKYGQYKFGRPGQDCDRDIARYATKHSAVAIFSSDTNFMIFDGYWKFWSFHGIDFDAFTVTEFDRCALNRELFLTFEQRPLLATLCGNDFINRDDLREFWLPAAEANSFPHARADNFVAGNRFYKVASYIHQLQRSGIEDDFDSIARRVFGRHYDDRKRQLIIDSVKSFDTNIEDEEEPTDPPWFHELLSSKPQLYRMYLNRQIDAVQRIEVPLIVEIGEENAMITIKVGSTKMNMLRGCLTEMVRKQVGLVNRESVDETFRVIGNTHSTVLSDETPIFPDFELVPMEVLLTGDSEDDTINQMRWKTFGWLLSISDHHRERLADCEKEFRIPCATLLLLVQMGIITTKDADGILITEIETRSGRAAHVTMPERMNLIRVNAVHVYKNLYRRLQIPFKLAGLFDFIPRDFVFNGVYFQILMASEQMFDERLATVEQSLRLYTE